MLRTASPTPPASRQLARVPCRPAATVGQSLDVVYMKDPAGGVCEEEAEEEEERRREEDRSPRGGGPGRGWSPWRGAGTGRYHEAGTPDPGRRENGRGAGR